MARGVNKVILIATLGKDPETRYTPSGTAVTSMTAATNEFWVDKSSGERKEKTEWHRLITFNRLAEIAGEYLKKGSKVYIEGKLQTRKWQDQQGQDRYTTEIVVNELQMLDGKPEGQSRQPAPQQAPQQQPSGPGGGYDDFDDTIPFSPIKHEYAM